ncbi:hypothetical protein [Candidatus Mycoplasma haematohominis]|uniref:hypothetical protein n=1 Tax=Candidatus Mycoplasma haematohominis TaxID=1494318 RepID=UPI001C0A6AD3|nr:hypothetical protein [Candidatus Mycoplasma haemohominis]
MDPIKLSAGALGAAVIVGSGLGINAFVNSLEPVWYSLSKESDFSTGYENKVGKDYGNYLVGAYGDEGENKDRNKWWWDWSYKNYQYDLQNSPSDLSQEFFHDGSSKVSSAYKSSSDKTTDSSPKALNEVCDGIYKGKTKTEADPDTDVNSEKSKLSRNLWRYCSHLGTRPVLISGDVYGNNTFGKKADHHNKAVATKDYKNTDSNDEFWRLRNDEFFGSKDEDGVGKKATDDGIFKTLYGKKKAGTITSEDTVKKACEKAYERKESEKDTVPKINDEYIKKFCYLVPDSNN